MESRPSDGFININREKCLLHWRLVLTFRRSVSQIRIVSVSQSISNKDCHSMSVNKACVSMSVNKGCAI